VLLAVSLVLLAAMRSVRRANFYVYMKSLYAFHLVIPFSPKVTRRA